MDNYNIDSKINFINSSDKSDSLSSNIYDSLIIKDNDIINNNGFIDKSLSHLDFFKTCENENHKIFPDSFLKSERETLSNSKKIFLNDSTNNKDLKKQLKLKRNRESAREGRKRKNLFIQNLIYENNFLRNKYNNLLNIIHKCPNCNENFRCNYTNDNHKKIGQKDNNLDLDERPKITKKKKLLFTTAIAIISIINIFNIPLNVMNYYKSIYNYKVENLRNLNNNCNHQVDYKKETHLLLNKLSSNNGDNEALYMHLAEFYSLTKREKINNYNKFDDKKEINKNIKIFHENQINIDQYNQNNATDCVKCVVELDKKSIKVGGDEFTFYLANRHLSKFFGNNQDGIFPNINSKVFNKKLETFPKFFALKCKILAYSINDLYLEKMDIK